MKAPIGSLYRNRITHLLALALVASAATIVSCQKEPEPVVRSDFRPEARDLALVLDTSGSMKRNDPNRMAIYATKIFADLMEQQDRLYVIQFPEKNVPGDRRGPLRRRRAPITFNQWASSDTDVIGPLPAADLKTRVEGIPYNSLFTVFQEPLEKAIRKVTHPQAMGSRAIVYFSDGDTDRYNDGQDHSDNHMEEVRLLRERIPELREHGVRFFGMSLGTARHDQFDPLAEASGGDVLTVARPQDLVDRFATVFSRILETRAEPIQFFMDNPHTFLVRPHVKELIFLIPNGSPEVQLRFQEPRETKWKVWEDGRSIDSADTRAKISGQCMQAGICRVDDKSKGAPGQENRYTILRIPHPRAGKWRACLTKSPYAEVKALLIQNYDLYLEVIGEKDREGWIGEGNRFEARLVNSKGEIIKDPEIFAGTTYRFTARDRNGKILVDEKVAPDEKYRMIYDFFPETEERINIRLSISNDDWLTRRVYLTFKGVKDIHLQQSNTADFGSLIPWTDIFIETLGAGVNSLVSLWTPGERRRCAWVDFSGSARQARGVTFILDNSELEEKYETCVVNEDGDALFTIDDNYRARICFEAARSSPGGNIGAITIPIRSSSGREVSGDTELAINGTVLRLPRVWGFMPFWLPLELYIALKLLKGLFFWGFYGYSRRIKLRQDTKGRGIKPFTQYFYPGPLGIYRIPLIPRLLSLPIYMVLSFFNFLRVAWVICTWDQPPIKPLVQDYLLEEKSQALSSRDRFRWILKAFVLDGLLFSIWLGATWRPNLPVGRKIRVVKVFGNKYFAPLQGIKVAGKKYHWRQQGDEIKIREGRMTLTYQL